VGALAADPVAQAGKMAGRPEVADRLAEGEIPVGVGAMEIAAIETAIDHVATTCKVIDRGTSRRFRIFFNEAMTFWFRSSKRGLEPKDRLCLRISAFPDGISS